MKRHLSYPMRLFCAFLTVCALPFCGLTAFAAEESSPEPMLTVTASPPSDPEVKYELYPADVQTIIEDSAQRIVKTYILTAGESPDNIPRDSFTLDGWRYELTDITQTRTDSPDAKSHTETLEISTDSNDINDILALLSATLEYESDGYCGLLTLDLASVKCEAAGYNNSSYTVTSTREYQHLSSNDLYFIPKTITENGRTLSLDGVEWAAQTVTNVGYSDIPDSYRAVATYKGKAAQSVVTGYVTTADYTGEIIKTVMGDTVYTAYFTGQCDAAPNDAHGAEQETEPSSMPAPDKDSGSIPIAPIIGVIVIVALLGGAAAFFFLRHNVKVYSVREDGYRALVAKVRISVKNPSIDLTPLDGRSGSKCFGLEIDKLAAKSLNGSTLDVIFGSAKLQHKIAYEGNPYQIEADFHDMTIKAVY